MTKRLLQIFAGNLLWHGSQKFIETDFAKEYDEDNLFKLMLVTIGFSLAKGIEEQEIDDECVKQVITLLKAENVDFKQMDYSKCALDANNFMVKYADFIKREYEDRYRLMEAVLYIFRYNGKNIKEYQDIIKLAKFLELRKNDFVYLVNKYKGE